MVQHLRMKSKSQWNGSSQQNVIKALPLCICLVHIASYLILQGLRTLTTKGNSDGRFLCIFNKMKTYWCRSMNEPWRDYCFQLITNKNNMRSNFVTTWHLYHQISTMSVPAKHYKDMRQTHNYHLQTNLNYILTTTGVQQPKILWVWWGVCAWHCHPAIYR